MNLVPQSNVVPLRFYVERRLGVARNGQRVKNICHPLREPADAAASLKPEGEKKRPGAGTPRRRSQKRQVEDLNTFCKAYVIGEQPKRAT